MKMQDSSKGWPEGWLVAAAAGAFAAVMARVVGDLGIGAALLIGVFVFLVFGVILGLFWGNPAGSGSGAGGSAAAGQATGHRTGGPAAVPVGPAVSVEKAQTSGFVTIDPPGAAALKRPPPAAPPTVAALQGAPAAPAAPVADDRMPPAEPPIAPPVQQVETPASEPQVPTEPLSSPLATPGSLDRTEAPAPLAVASEMQVPTETPVPPMTDSEPRIQIEASAPVMDARSMDGVRPVGLDAPRGGGADRLQAIEGIGPVLERLCHEMGIYHFDQIAAWGAAETAWMDGNLKGFRGRVTRDKWVRQARRIGEVGVEAFLVRAQSNDY